MSYKGVFMRRKNDLQKAKILFIFLSYYYIKISLTLRGVLSPGSVHTRHSAKLPIDVIEIIPLHISAKSPSIIPVQADALPVLRKDFQGGKRTKHTPKEVL